MLVNTETQTVTVRPFAPGDALAFHGLNMAWVTAFFHVEAKDEAALSDPEGSILAPGGHILLADVDTVTVGCVALLPMPGGEYEVAKMAVAPAAQGRGVGRLLLEAALAWARARGAKRLYLESNARLTPALRLYESVGFQHLPPNRRPISPYARADVFMELVLEGDAGVSRG